jgi:lipoprotein-anchoring transpeptidase ErfK/SrfK
VKRIFLFCLVAGPMIASADAPPLAIDIDLGAQKAFLLQEGKIVYETPISSGRPGHPTPTGYFQVLDKDENHLSTLYGKIVDAQGKTLVPNADSAMPVPAGGRFVQAPMRHFLRFDGATGLHEGYLPGYPASHGCVRLPAAKAALFFDIAQVGTPVRVHGTPPNTAPPAPKTQTASAAPRAAQPAPAASPAPRKWFQIFGAPRKTAAAASI